MSIDAVLFPNFLCAPQRMSLNESVFALPMSKTMDHRWCLLSRRKLECGHVRVFEVQHLLIYHCMSTNVCSFLSSELAICFLSSNFPLPTFLGQSSLLSLFLYIVLLPLLVFLLVALQEGDIINLFGCNLAWFRQLLDIERIQRRLCNSVILS